MIRAILKELKVHVPFTFFGAVIGILIALIFSYAKISHEVSEHLFETFHPAHVFFSAIVTGAVFKLHSGRGIFTCLLVAYVGSIGIGTLSDSLIPFFSELFVGKYIAHDCIHAEAHIGFIDMWWLVNPLAIAGGFIGVYMKKTKFPHLMHVFLSTAASLFHILGSIVGDISFMAYALFGVFLFIAVWLPCCTSDIVFPMLFCPDRRKHKCCSHH